MNFLNFLYINNLINGTDYTSDEFLAISNRQMVKNRNKLSLIDMRNQVNAVKFALLLKREITIDDIKEIHKELLRDIDDATGGRVRSINLHYNAMDVQKIDEELENFCLSIGEMRKRYLYEIVSYIHYQFIKISPFTTENHQVARFICLPFIMKNEKDLHFINESQIEEYKTLCEYAKSVQEFEEFFRDIYPYGTPKIKVVDKAKKLLKIGDVAFWSGEPISKIRFWTKTGLIKAELVTDTGHLLFGPETVKLIKKIKSFKKRGNHLKEIIPKIQQKKS